MQPVRHFPDGITEKNLHGGKGLARHASPLSIILLGTLLLLGMIGIAGGDRSIPVQRDFGPATMTVNTPATLRNGEFFETRIMVHANADIADATIAITPGLWRDMTINTTLPDPANQKFDDGLLRWSYGPMKAGDTLLIKVDGQINPPLFAGTKGAFLLYDGDARLGRLPFSIKVFSLMDIVLRATAMFAVLYALLRLLGKRELGQLTPFELVVLIVMGDLIQQGVTHNDFSVTGATLAICTFAFWGVVLSWLSYLFPRLKDPLEGLPQIIIRDGELCEENLRRDRLTRAEIESEMRLAGIAHIGKVAWAILEPQGKISFIKRDDSDSRQSDNDPSIG